MGRSPWTLPPDQKPWIWWIAGACGVAAGGALAVMAAGTVTAREVREAVEDAAPVAGITVTPVREPPRLPPREVERVARPLPPREPEPVARPAAPPGPPADDQLEPPPDHASDEPDDVEDEPPLAREPEPQAEPTFEPGGAVEGGVPLELEPEAEPEVLDESRPEPSPWDDQPQAE